MRSSPRPMLRTSKAIIKGRSSIPKRIPRIAIETSISTIVKPAQRRSWDIMMASYRGPGRRVARASSGSVAASVAGPGTASIWPSTNKTRSKPHSPRPPTLRRSLRR